jgi:hypothetical protein
MVNVHILSSYPSFLLIIGKLKYIRIGSTADFLRAIGIYPQSLLGAFVSINGNFSSWGIEKINGDIPSARVFIPTGRVNRARLHIVAKCVILLFGENCSKITL